MDQVKTALLVQVLNSFVTGILTIVVPLMMDARHIDIVTIGFVFAAMPIIFQLGRMVFAIVSDFWGRKPFFPAKWSLRRGLQLHLLFSI